MRGDDDRQAEMLLALTADQLVPTDHPVRRIKPVVEPVLARLSPRFDGMYADRGRPSIPPEHLLKASLLIALYSIRSERQFCERLRYDFLFKWFLDLNVADPGFDASSFSKNRERLLAHEVARAFFAEVVDEARRLLLSAEHFAVDGTLLEAWASLKSYRPRAADGGPCGGRKEGGRNPAVDFRGQRRRRETHVSTTDPQARLFTKGARRRGVPEDTARTIFAKINGHYLFPESHSHAFAITAYQAAWLKRSYPGEFFVALVNQQPMGFSPLETLKEDARRCGVPFRTPCLNRSRARAIPEDGSVRLGLQRVKAVGRAAASVPTGKAGIALALRLW